MSICLKLHYQTVYRLELKERQTKLNSTTTNRPPPEERKWNGEKKAISKESIMEMYLIPGAYTVNSYVLCKEHSKKYTNEKYRSADTRGQQYKMNMSYHQITFILNVKQSSSSNKDDMQARTKWLSFGLNFLRNSNKFKKKFILFIQVFTLFFSPIFTQLAQF